mgnify:CR=1 FL=1
MGNTEAAHHSDVSTAQLTIRCLRIKRIAQIGIHVPMNASANSVKHMRPVFFQLAVSCK